MTNLNHNLLLYDEYCPICNWYSAQFVRLGLIQPEERKSYQSMIKYKDSLSVDFELAKNKIAYFMYEDKSVHYGVDAILAVFATPFPSLTNIARWKPIYILLEVAYSFISYNRKIIAPSMSCSGDNCTPDKNWLYRIAFILISWALVISIVGRYFMTAYPTLLRWPISYMDAYVFGAQFIFQGAILKFSGNKNYYDYFGHLALVSMVGALLLWSGYLILHFIPLSYEAKPLLYSTYFGAVLCYMFILHMDRMKQNELPKIMSFSWLVFRLIAATTVFKLF